MKERLGNRVARLKAQEMEVKNAKELNTLGMILMRDRPDVLEWGTKWRK